MIFKVLDNFIGNKELISSFFNKYILFGDIRYSFTNVGKTEDNQPPHSFTSSLPADDFSVPLISDVYKKLSLIDDQIFRWHINIHPSLYDGVIHEDYDYIEENRKPTYLYCVTPGWIPEWGGEFIVYDNNKEANNVVSFKEDRLIMFDGSLPHRAVGPTRLSSLLRVTIAFQSNKLIKGMR